MIENIKIMESNVLKKSFFRVGVGLICSKKKQPNSSLGWAV